jgi:iron(III) transport system ATP-binding protein
VGAESLIEVRMDHDGTLLRAAVPGAWLPPVGEALWLSLRRDRCFVFPCERQSKVASPWESDRDASGKRVG